jgi:hypothetical protein
MTAKREGFQVVSNFARFSTLSGAGFGAGLFWTTVFWAGLTAWGLLGIGFLATGLVGMAKKHLPHRG